MIIYFLGVIPNFLPGIGLPSLFYVIIPEVFKPNSSFYKERLKLSIYISMFGLICNEFITIFTPGRGVFDWNDIVWTLMGGGVFLIIHRKINEVEWKINSLKDKVNFSNYIQFPLQIHW